MAMAMDQTTSDLESPAKDPARARRDLTYRATAATRMVTANTATDTATTAAAPSLGKDRLANHLKVHRVRAGRVPTTAQLVEAAPSLGKDHPASLRKVRRAKVLKAPIHQGHPRVAKALASRVRQQTAGSTMMGIARITTIET